MKVRSTWWFMAFTRFYSACEDKNFSVIAVFYVSDENCIAQQSLSYILEIKGVFFGRRGVFYFFSQPASYTCALPSELSLLNKQTFWATKLSCERAQCNTWRNSYLQVEFKTERKDRFVCQLHRGHPGLLPQKALICTRLPRAGFQSSMHA